MPRGSSLFALIELCAISLFAAENLATKGIPWRDNGFDRNLLLRDTMPEKQSPFSIEQSYMFDYFIMLLHTSFK
jgi:hypothetical protein